MESGISRGGKLATPGVLYSRLVIRCRPPDEYDLTIQAERKVGKSGLFIGILAGGRQTMILLDARDGTVSGLNLLDGRSAGINEAKARGGIFPQDQQVTITCEVRKSGILVRSGDSKIIDWQGDLKRLSLAAEWPVEDTSALFLGSTNTSYIIHSAILTPISGPGEIVTPH